MAEETDTPAGEPIISGREDMLATQDEVRENTQRRSPWPWRIGKILIGLMVGLVVLITLALFGLNTKPGRNFVAGQIEALTFENGMAIGIDRIDGSLYGKMTITGLTLADPKGVFLRSPAVEMDWRPFAFINSHIDIRSLGIKTLVLERSPEFAETPPNQDPLLPDYDIDVGKLEISQFIAMPPVSGERRIATLKGNVHIASGRAQAKLNGTTIAGPTMAGGDKMALILDAVPETNRFDLDFELDAPSNGIIAALAGLNQPLRVTLKGAGDWAKWDGNIRAVSAGNSIADLGLTGRQGTFGVAGTTRLTTFVSPATAALLGPVTNLNYKAVLDQRKVDVDGRVFSDAFNLTTIGLVDLSDNSFNDFKANFVLLKPSAIAPNLSGNGIRASLRLDGAFAEPRVQYAITAARIVMNDMGVENLRANGDARVNSDSIMIPVSATAARITGLDTVAGGTLAGIRLNGDLAMEGTRILSDNMRIQSNRINAGLILIADTSTGLYAGAIDGKIDNYRVESAGIFNIETNVELKTARDGSFALAGKLGARSTSLSNESVRNFLGGNLVASTDVHYGSDGTARFANVRLTAPDFRIIQGRGSYSQDGQLNVLADAVSSQYGPIGLTLAGTVTNPRAIIKAAKPGLGIGLAGLTANIRGDGGNYRIDADGQTDYGPLTADVLVKTATGPLTMTINHADFAGIGLSGTIAQSSAGPFVGRLDANGRGLGGVVRLASAGQYQSAVVNLRANNTVLPGPANLRIGSAIVDANIILYERPEIVADIQLAQTYYGTLNLNVMRALVDYRNGRGKAKVLAEGNSGVPFRISANADLQPNLWRASLAGTARGIAFKTASPARIIPGKSSYELLPAQIDFGQGNIRLAGNYGAGIKLQSRLDALDLSIVNALAPGLGINGSASGSLDFAQASADAFPTADARMTINGFSRTTALSVSQPVDVSFVGQLQASGGAARAVVRRRGAVIGRMNAALTPLSPGTSSWTSRLMGAPLRGGIRYNGPADTLFSLAGQADQRLSGSIGVAADFSGRVSQPALSGIIRANDLTYENQIYGTRLSKMAISGRFTGERLEIDRLNAVAGDGTVAAAGFVSFAADSGYPMDVKIALDNARLARSDAVSATATGNLNFTKQSGQPALFSGTIRLPETRYQVIRQGVEDVPELTGVRFKPPRGRPRVTGNEPAAPSAGLLGSIQLDIAVVAPEQLYVSGMGLESEWKADVRLTGTSAAPRMSGSVDLVRGTLGFAGRSFDLTEGQVQFTGGQTLDPTITLVATDDVDNVLINVNVTGRAFNPQIAFSSTPGLPQDEIMSRILFGNSVGNLSAIQAVQLASSLNSLRGSGGGLNPMGKLRSATGIDRLRILGADDATGRGTSLAAGQYLTDDIYLEVITDARGFTATQLEISLTPALSVLSQAGGAVGTNVNVRYQKNY